MFSQVYAMLVNPVECSHPENLLGIEFSITCFTSITAAFHFGCSVLKLEKLTALMNHLGGLNLAWWLN